MLRTAAQFFEIFDRHGFLKSASWRPSSGGPEQIIPVHLMAPGSFVDGEQIITTRHTITYPATQMLGLNRGDLLVIDGKTYDVREVMPRPGTDGTEMLAGLELV